MSNLVILYNFQHLEVLSDTSLNNFYQLEPELQQFFLSNLFFPTRRLNSMKFSLSKFRLLCFISMKFSHSLYLVDMIEKPEGVHNINTKLFSISFPQLRSLQKLALESTNFDYSSAEYRVIAIILDIANYRLFRPVRSDVPAEKPKHFMKIKFLNKAVDAINLPALLRSTSVTDKIPVYFRDKEPPIVSYEYTSTVASKLFNFAPTLSNLNVSEYLIHKLASVRNPSFAMNHMAMLSLEI